MSPPRSEEPKRTGGSGLTTQKKETKISNKGKSLLRRYQSQTVLEMMFSIVRQPPMAEFKGVPHCALKKSTRAGNAHICRALSLLQHQFWPCRTCPGKYAQRRAWWSLAGRGTEKPQRRRSWRGTDPTRRSLWQQGPFPLPAASFWFPKPPSSSPVPQPCVCGINYRIVKQLVISHASAAVACNGSISEQNDM